MAHPLLGISPGDVPLRLCLHRQAARKREQEERALAEERAREKSQRSYKLLQVDEKKESNKDVGLNVDEYEDDFM